MDIKRFGKILRDKERELESSISLHREEALEAQPDGAEDRGDMAVADEDKDLALAESDMERQTLQQVRDALERIERGTFGRCVDCGRQIDEARLEALPWTPYCATDGPKHERGITGRPATL